MGKFANKNLDDLSQKGIRIHHAGLEQLDRKQGEESFLTGRIKVLCTTSTLSVGVNFPARCVIIRGTRSFKGANPKSTDGFEDYSELDLAQMKGRAGRPQFDTEGVAVIMTSQADKV
ncbi:putative ATP-dependent DNA helicase mer3 [Phakopsora pachyrhizi]|uniref:ATP-dependent DNA helicase mer3 n=1 Tax=Phakopsora pachyrhizi TaxID=170000 RepID=A0AAV0BHV8_PHAPC|nr:putative ATP-dependent DNA helicase mer3 [Phakopsora pachyrhizi]